MSDDARFDWGQFGRPLPAWFSHAKLGIFIHWGAYSVPAWAETTGELGEVEEREWFRHNPYAEWYWNSIRFEDNPARQHHRERYGDAPYDHFLGAWTADEFDPSAWMKLFAEVGADYVVPTTKHHDGIALWEAPGTGSRNTLRRGPRKDLIGELGSAARSAGLRFGVYYSGGLDWSVSHLPVIDTGAAVRGTRPTDAAYATYAYLHVRDLIDRYHPDVLWNDIEWPDAGKHGERCGLGELFEYYYSQVPEGVVNDRWGVSHCDYKTSEYKAHLESEQWPVWEHCRGIGLSFGYNQMEDESHLMSGNQLIRLLVDVVSRGGKLLLNIGPTASGEIPQGQRRVLEQLGEWMKSGRSAVEDSSKLDPSIASATNEPWTRWTADGSHARAVIDATGEVDLRVHHERLDITSGRWADGTAVVATPSDSGVKVDVPAGASLPAVATFEVR